MTAETLTSLSNFMSDMIGPMQETFSKRTVLHDELKRNTRRSNFIGRQVRIPLIKNVKQGTGNFAETGTVNIARQLNDDVAYVTMARISHAIEISLDLMKAVEARDWAAAGDALKLHMDQAEIAMTKTENEEFWGAGDALVAAITGANTGAVVPVGTSANFYQLYPGRVGDVLVRSNGATVSLGREIVSNDPVAGTITLDTTVVTSNLHGFYIEGSYGNAIQGIRQPFATSGTFQGVNLANVPQFRGVEGRGASPAAADLSMAVLDGAGRRLSEASGVQPDFWVGDPAAIDKFGQSLVAQFRWQPKITRLQTGWEGIDYRGRPLIPDSDAPAGELYGINKSALTMYGYEQGPNWDESTGTKFQRFTRSAPVEAWLLDFVQLGFHKPNALVRVPVLNRAA
jgi:hypothetical protein